MRRYAERTAVPVLRSELEIKRVLQRYGADRIGIMSEPRRATIYFSIKGRDVQMPIPFPLNGDLLPGKKYAKWTAAAAQAEERRRWRVMVLTLKAMLEAVESGVTTFDEVFLAHVVIGNQTVGQMLVPRLGALTTGTPLRELLAENPGR
jgi:hypothetical protein